MFFMSERTLSHTGTALLVVLTVSSINAQILRNEHDIMKAARHAGDMQILTRAKSNSYSQQFLSNLLGESSDIVDRARQTLYEGLVANEIQYNVSSLCLNHTERLLEGIVSGEEWALRMVDAMGKPHSGLLNAHFTWLGDYDECRAVQSAVRLPDEISSPYTGRYCKAAFGNYRQQPSLTPQGIVVTIGVCVPSSCNANDTTALLNTFLSLLPINTTALSNPTVACQLESLELETKAIVVIIICSLFGLVMVAATAYDVVIIHWWNDRVPKYEALKEECEKINPESDQKRYGTTDVGASYQASYQANGHVAHEAVEIGKVDLTKTKKQSNQPGTLGKVLLSFSVYSNAAKILNTNQPAGTLTAVNGIRFISMTWVIMGHSYGFGISAAENMVTFMPKMLKRFTFQAIANATVSVDTFFTLSGLLVAYLSLKEMKKRGGAKKMNWAMFYFHRFWRLTPPYMLFLMFYVCLTKYWSDGPLWPQQGLEVDDCKDTWWKNLLYINNLVETDKQCMGWSWYLANDMQFYILSPLMLIPLYYSTLLGSLSCLALLLVNFISTGVISARDELGASILSQNADENMQDVYIKPWCRIGPYVVGVFAGYILYKTDCRIRIPKILNILGWISATAIALLVLYGLYDSSGFPTLSVGVSAFYNATNRSAWGLAVAWVIVACATGNGGFINTLLSWKGIIPLSRLTYCAYLVHLVVMDTYYLSKRSLVYLTDLEEIYVFCGHLCLSYAVAFVVSLTFESPMMGLEKALLGRGKNS